MVKTKCLSLSNRTKNCKQAHSPGQSKSGRYFSAEMFCDHRGVKMRPRVIEPTISERQIRQPRTCEVWVLNPRQLGRLYFFRETLKNHLFANHHGSPCGRFILVILPTYQFWIRDIDQDSKTLRQIWKSTYFPDRIPYLIMTRS